MTREDALDFWMHEQVHSMIFSFNRFKKLQFIEQQTKLSTSDCESLLATKLFTLPYFYEFDDPIERLILLPPNILERICIFLGCSHFIKEINILSLQDKDHEFFSLVNKEVLDFAKGQGRLLIGNKRPSNVPLLSNKAKDYSLELNVPLVTFVGACYLSNIKMDCHELYTSPDIKDTKDETYDSAKDLNATWLKRLEPFKNKLLPEQRSFLDQDQQQYFNDICAMVPIENAVLRSLVLSIIELYEEVIWKAFFK